MVQPFKIRIYGDPILKKKVESVRSIRDEEKEIFTAMGEILHKSGGVGLAANQVGINKRMFVIDIGSGLIKMANPKIIKKYGKQVSEEGCLSLPELIVKVKRAKHVVVSGLNEYNQIVKLDTHDLLARVFQHEIDHLNGKLLIDYLPWYRKILKKGRKY